MNTLVVIIIIIIIFKIVWPSPFIKVGKKENYGVFSHRGVLNGTHNRSRSYYSLNELDHQNPSNYWVKAPLNIYDLDIQKYHSKRFNPLLIM